MSSAMEIAREWLKRFHMLRIPAVFLKRIWPGFGIYKRFISQYGENITILGTAWRGNGDYYICAGYLGSWLQKNGIDEYVFLTPGGAEEKVLGLFPILKNHVVRLEGGEKAFSWLLHFRSFLGVDRCKFYNFHHQQAFVFGNLSSGMLQGFRGLNMVDFYLACGFGLEPDTPRDMPHFDDDESKSHSWFLDNNLQPGKTVLLAPYSTGLGEFLPPELFWETFAQRFKEEGFSVCTNCAGTEKPIPGTTSLMIPFKELVPFLDRAGWFVGIRSGLCDVISTSHCKKLIVHPYKAKWWPDGRSIAYTGIKNMGLCDDVIEIDNIDYIGKIISAFLG